jgi:phosphoribosylformylglycinamidine synthase
MRYIATLHVRTKPEIRDPQGEAALGALRSLGLDVTNVRTGKEIMVTFEATDDRAAHDAIRVMGNELLANPVIEDYEYDAIERASLPSPRAGNAAVEAGLPPRQE